jgi:hypothetical protein
LPRGLTAGFFLRAACKHSGALGYSPSRSFAFDPFGFTLLKPAQQAEVLRGIVKLDFTTIDSARQKAFNERTLVNRDLDQQKALVARLPVHKDAPAAEESSAEVVAEIERAQTQNRTFEIGVDDVHRAEDDVSLSRIKIREIQEQIAELNNELEGHTRRLESNEKHLADERKRTASYAQVDIAPLKAKLSGLEAANAKVRANKQRADAEAAVKAKQAASDALSLKIQNCDEEREATLKAAKFPVPGLSFGENGVLLDGLPFSQAGDAEQIRVSVAIAAALNPKIRVMLIHDGSLIGTRKMELIRQLAEEHNLQVWIEVVSDKDDKKSSVVIEDGHVVGQEVPEEEPAAPAEPTTIPPEGKVFTQSSTVATKDAPAPKNDLFDLPPSR